MESFGRAGLAGRAVPRVRPSGSGAAVLPLRDPLWVAKQAASLDQLTEGRFTLVLAPVTGPTSSRPRAGTSPGGGPSGGRNPHPQRGLGGRRPGPRTLSPALDAGRPAAVAGRCPGDDASRDPARPAVPGVTDRTDPTGPDGREWFDGGGTVLAVRVRFGLRRATSSKDDRATGPARSSARPLSGRADRRLSRGSASRTSRSCRARTSRHHCAPSRRWSSRSFLPSRREQAADARSARRLVLSRSVRRRACARPSCDADGRARRGLDRRRGPGPPGSFRRPGRRRGPDPRSRSAWRSPTRTSVTRRSRRRR